MEKPSERWGALRDREALGEELSEAELAECARLEASDADVQAEAAVWRELEGFLESDEAPAGLRDGDRAIVEAAMAKLAAPGEDGESAGGRLHEELTGRHRLTESGAREFGDGPDWIGRTAMALTGVLAAAAAVALVVWEPAADDPRPRATSGQAAQGASGAGEPAPVAPTIVRLSEAKLAARSGDVERDGQLLQGGQALREGDALHFRQAGCLDLQPKVEVCAASGSELVLSSLALERRVIEVRRGRAVAALRKQPEGTHFALRGQDLTARAVGTIYSLTHDAEEVRVRVLEGIVEVRRGAEELRVEAGEAAVWSSESGLGPAGLTPRDQQDDLALAETGRDRTAQRAAAPRSGASGVQVQPSAPTGKPAEERAKAEAPPAVGELMRQAWELLRAKKHEEAARAYERVRRLHPRSREAHVIQVRLGDLRLQHLGDPKGALAAYRGYLESGAGPLAAEARLGVIRALRRLGDATAERKAIDDYLAHHADSLNAAGLRKRRQALGGE